MGTAEVLREPIAIIGTGCRFPGQASSPSRLWQLLRRPRDLLRRIPEDRFGSDGFYHPDPEYHGNSNTKHSYFLDENVRQFDTQFFGIKPVEANAIDPQQRLLLEVVYEYVALNQFIYYCARELMALQSTRGCGKTHRVSPGE